MKRQLTIIAVAAASTLATGCTPWATRTRILVEGPNGYFLCYRP